MLILWFGDILSTLADRESVLGVAESQQHLHLRELDRIRHTAEHPRKPPTCHGLFCKHFQQKKRWKLWKNTILGYPNFDPNPTISGFELATVPAFGAPR